MNGGGAAIPFRLARVDARGFRAGLHTDLAQLLRDVGHSVDRDAEARMNALRTFYQGALASLMMFEDYRALLDLFQTNFGHTSLLGPPPLFELHGRDQDFFPLELLPLFAWSGDDQGDSVRALELASRAFVGMSAVVRRLPDAGSLSNEVLLHHGLPLPLRMVWDASLDGARRERSFFQGLHDEQALDLRGPWPDTPVDQRDAARILGSHIHDATRDADGGVLEVSDRVHHFSCHCVADERNPRQTLRIGCESTRVRLPMAAVFAAIEQRARKPGKEGGWAESQPPPFAFINACASGMLPVDFAGSFLEIYWRRGCASIIGTEAAVPDDFAADFAATFYMLLRQEGVSTGLALLQAKRLMLRDAANPLGLLYTLYGNPDLQWTGASP